jgi:uncharacterized protein (TIGR03084 family)
MLQQADDFREESQALFDLLADLDSGSFTCTTAFKDWTVNDVIRHLHVWNVAADLSLTDESEFARLLDQVSVADGLREFELNWLGGMVGTELLETWRDFFIGMSERFVSADPKRRVKWAGPDMSVRSSITARLMETWAHGQEVYDALGVVRTNTDRIKNIAVLGINTYGWTYQCRGLTPPENPPFVRLTAPSGEIWTWNEEDDGNCIAGSAEGFCQTVTQVRNVADTDLVTVGDVATQWMSMAQCFAGPPETPPPPGSRIVTKPRSDSPLHARP